MLALTLALLAASPTALPASASGTYFATRSDAVASGRTCAIGPPLDPPFVLQIGDAHVEGIPSTAGILVDDAGVAMPLVERSDNGFDLVDLSVAPSSPERLHGTVRLAADEPLTVEVDYGRWGLDCRVRGRVEFTRSADEARLQRRTGALADAMAAVRRRDALRDQGKSREALEPALAAEALFASELGKDHRLTLKARAKIGSLHWDLDELAIARDIGEEVLARIDATLGSDHVQALEQRSNVGVVLWEQGDLAGAEALFRSVAGAYASVLDPDDGRRLGTLTNLASLLGFRGRYVEAEAIMLEVLGRRERAFGPDHPMTLITINNLSSIYGATGRREDQLRQLATAIERYDRSLGGRHPATLRARHNYAATLAELDRRVEAIQLLREVLAARREATGPRHAETLFTQQILALQLALDGDTDEALALQREVVEQREAAAGATNFETLRAHAALGRIETRAGKHAQAVERLERAYALALQTLGGGDRFALEIGMQLGLSQRSAGDLAGARRTLRQVVGGIEAWRDTGALTASGRQALFSRWVPSYKALAAVELEGGDVAAAFEQAELSKARALVETLAMRRGSAEGGLPADSIAALDASEARIAALEQRIARAGGDRSARLPLEQQRLALAKEAKALRDSLRERYPRYAALTQARVISLSEGARELPPRSVFVSYLRDGERVLAFTLDRQGRLRGRDLGRYAGLDDAIAAFRTLLAPAAGATRMPVWRMADGRFATSLVAPEGAVRVDDAAKVGGELYARLVAPLGELASASRWIVSPDGGMALLPFEALSHRGRMLVASREISYAPSLTVHALSVRRGRAYDRLSDRVPLYAMGAAQYDAVPGADSMQADSGQPARGRPRWTDLPASAEEVAQVVAGFGPGAATVRIRAEATEQRLLDDDRTGRLARHRYVLLSAHGFVSHETPGLSAVVLGQRQATPAVDGYVTALEWAGYTLQSDLIVLSACETGAGRVIEGEGVTGLPYALFVAGNRNLLLTLWPVFDRSTAQFVARLFRHLRAGMTHSAALTRTKREFASDRLHAMPAYWAPFVLWGG